MTARRGRGDEGCLLLLLGIAAFLIVQGIVKDLAHKYGDWVWVVAILGSIAAYRLLTLYATRQRAKKEEARLKLPCVHGTIGGAADSTKCRLCQQENQARVEEAQRRRAEEARRRLEARQAQFNEWKAQVRTPAYLKTMDPREFENLACVLFSQMGYEVEETPYVGDGGIDGFLKRDGRLSLLQCKRVHGSVGEPILRDLYGNMMSHSADEASSSQPEAFRSRLGLG